MSWRDDAACLDSGLSEDAWYAYGQEKAKTWDPYQAARAVCHTCPVAAPCLEFALEHDREHGMYGGMTPAERSALVMGNLTSRLRADAPRCGTVSGAQKHKRLGQEPCDACRTAANNYYADRRSS